MPILRNETSLSEAEYAALPTSTGSMSAQTVLQRYGPVWTEHPNDTSGRTGECFDAALVGGYLLRAYGCTVSEVSADYMPSEISGIADSSWAPIDCTAIDDIDTDIPITIVNSGLTVRMFYADAAGVIKYSECTDITSNAFDTPVPVCDPSEEVLQVAASSMTRVHYITKTSQDNRLFHYAEYDVAWSIVDSDVYWPFPVYSLDAIALDTKDLLVIAGELSPLIGSRAIGTSVSSEVNGVQSLTTFEVANERWSDWIAMDTIDRLPDSYSRSRENVRMSYHNGFLFTTYTRAGGDSDHQYSRPAVTRSADGNDWEYPEFVPDVSEPFVILPRDDYLYAVGVSGTLRSPCCAWAGQDPVEFDITPYVLQIESQAAEIRNSGIELANPPTSVSDIFQGVLAGELATNDARLQLRYDLGYYIDGDGKRVTVSTEDIVARGEQRGLPRLGLTLESRDYLGRVNRTRSDYAAEWPGMQCGKDPFNDTTGTGYGGLRHMAPIKPSFTADNGVLELLSSNKEAVAVSTFVSDALCGSAQTSFDLVYSDQDEMAGIVFRVFDKDNLFYCAYYPDDNVFKLYKRVGTVAGDDGFLDTLLATSDTITDWIGTETDKHYLKVVVHYNKFMAYKSDDGTEWDTLRWPTASYVELPGYTSDTEIAWSGRFGVIGYGYSDADDPPPWVPPPWLPPVIPPPAVEEPDVAILWTYNMVLRTTNFTDVNPDWTVEVLGLGSGDYVDGANEINFLDIDQGTGWAWAATKSGIWACDMTTSGNMWEQRKSISQIRDLMTHSFEGGHVGCDECEPSSADSISMTDTPFIVSLRVYDDHILAVDNHVGAQSCGYVGFNKHSWNGGRFIETNTLINECSADDCATGLTYSVDMVSSNTPGSLTGARFRIWSANQANRVISPHLGHVVGRIISTDYGLANCAGDAATRCACDSALSLTGPLMQELRAYYLVNPTTGYPHGYDVQGGTCPGNGNWMWKGIDGITDGDGSWAIYEQPVGTLGMINTATSVPFFTGTSYPPILGTGPNGYKDKGWVGVTIGGERRLVDRAGNILLAPEDFFGTHGALGYTEGFHTSGNIMCTIAGVNINSGAGNAYAVYSNDGGRTWTDKTFNIRSALGLHLNWSSKSAQHGIAFFQRDLDFEP